MKPGGILLYSTCTLNRAENEDMAAFIEKELLMKPVLKNTTAEKGYVRLTPHVQDTDGFFLPDSGKKKNDREKDIKSMPMETLAAEMEALGVKNSGQRSFTTGCM